MYAYKDGDRVKFDCVVFSGEGIVKGVATAELPILGCNYIIDVIKSTPELPNDLYPFSTVSVAENLMSKVEHE